ncbi:MAG: calcium/sodium antiporter [Chlorobiota bacterium]
MIITIILFIVGFFILIKGADYLVDGSSSIASKYNISNLIIGLTIVSFGTSAPELIINILASFSGSSDIAVGNVLGSNIANIFLILGITALISNLPMKKSTVFSEIPFTLLAVFLVGFLANISFFDKSSELVLSQIEGIILLVFFVLFLGYIYILSKEDDDIIEDVEIGLSKGKSILYIVLGMTGLFLGGKWVVDGALEFAGYFNLSESFVGLTVVSLGTSLPELVTSVNAAKKGNSDIAVGNIVGSNIFNLLWILGVSATIKELTFTLESNMDILVTAFASIMLLISMTYGKKYSISKRDGVIYLLCYAAYLVYIYYR